MRNERPFLPMDIVIKGTSGRYANEFLALKCNIDMIHMKLFPNFKEITESFGAYHAARKHLWRRWFPPDDPNVTLFAVGDGHTPRTAATFAFRTRWQCVSIDPYLKEGYEHKIQRLTCLRKKVEEAHEDIPAYSKAVIVAVHSHANLDMAYETILKKCRGGRIAVIAIPCCVPQTLKNWQPQHEYTDYAIWSPQRLVKIWI